ncbi:MAG: ATP-binding protein [Reichenbachiella sp.]|uniref:ATP-binding protein n=1 Tax=Reichenbachiella sp. TaxID=2184521 RepID=UPI003265144C
MSIQQLQNSPHFGKSFMTLLFNKSRLPLFLIIHFLAVGNTANAQISNNRSEERVITLLTNAKTNLNRQNLSLSLSQAQSALSTATTIGDEQKIWEAKNLIGEIYLTQGDFQRAIQLFLGLSMNAEKINNYSVSANGYLSLANIYSHMGAFTKAAETYDIAYEQFDQIDYELGMIEVKAAASLNFLIANQNEQALKAYQQLLSLAVQDSLAYFKLIAHDGLLEVYQKLNDYDKGLEIGESYLQLIQTEGGSPQMAANANNQIAALYLNAGENDQAIEALKKAENICLTNSINNKILANTYQQLAKAYQAKNQDQQAQTYDQKYKSLSARLPKSVSYDAQGFEEAEATARSLEQEARAIVEEEALIITQAESSKREEIKNDEIARLKILEHEALVGNRNLGHSALEAEYIHQDLMIAQHEFESTERQAEILRYKESLIRHQLELKLAEEEKLILEQEAEISEKRQLIYLIIGGAFVIIALILGVEYVRVSRLNSLLKKQQATIHQRNVELQLSNATIMEKNAKLHRAHDELKRTQANLIQAEKMSALGMLTAGIAHEVNNPISFVSNGLQILEENISEAFDSLSTFEQILQLENLDEIKSNYNIHKAENTSVSVLKKDTADLLEDVKFGATRIIEIVDGLRIFSRKDEKKFKKAHLHEIIDSALLISKSKYKGRVQIIKEYGNNIPAIDCFPGQLNQIFINLIGNASDAIEGEGWIKIMLQDISGKYVRAIVQDSGSGMTDDVKKKIFEPLYTTKESGKGTGLGLSISTDIMKTHRGHIDVRSKVGVGTAFILTLQVDLMKDKNEVVQDS